MSVVGVIRLKRLSELFETDFTGVVGIVSLEEEVNLIVCGEHSNCGKTFTNFSSGNLSIVVGVEDGEGIVQVEVGFQSKVHFGGFKLTLLGNCVAETIHKLVFFVQVKDWLLAGAHAGVASTWEVSASGAATAREVGATTARASTDGAAVTNGGATSRAALNSADWGALYSADW